MDLAATDPDRAEQIANSLTEEHQKTRAQSHLAWALTFTDPDRAERTANAIPDLVQKAQSLGVLAGAGTHRP